MKKLYVSFKIIFLVPQREKGGGGGGGEHVKKPQQSNCIEKMLGKRSFE